MLKIKFKGMEFVFVGYDLTEGAIALREDYENFRPSFAHLFPNGEIRRHGSLIGSREDIEILGKTDD